MAKVEASWKWLPMKGKSVSLHMTEHSQTWDREKGKGTESSDWASEANQDKCLEDDGDLDWYDEDFMMVVDGTVHAVLETELLHQVSMLSVFLTHRPMALSLDIPMDEDLACTCSPGISPPAGLVSVAFFLFRRVFHSDNIGDSLLHNEHNKSRTTWPCCLMCPISMWNQKSLCWWTGNANMHAEEAVRSMNTCLITT